MIGVVLLYVGAVLFVNGLWILGKVQDKEVAIINLFTGAVGFLVAMFSIFRGDLPSVEFGAYVLLFAFTYLWVAYNRFTNVDGKGLGWYCFFVAVTAVPVGLTVLSQAGGKAWLIWLGLNWLAWAVLWFLYFLLLALQKPIARFTGLVTIAQAVATGWLPGYLIISGRLAL